MNVVGTAADGRIYALASDGVKPAAFGILDPSNDTFQSLYQDPVAGIHDFLYSADGRQSWAWSRWPVRRMSNWSNPNIPTQGYAALSKAFPGELVDVTSATGRQEVVVSVYSDTDPGQLYLFDRDSGSVRFLMKSRPGLDPARWRMWCRFVQGPGGKTSTAT